MATSPLPMRWRQLALASQGLSARKPFGRGFSGTLAAIEHLGYVQIDTLSVVERAHHHVLWSRVPGYSLQHLNRLTCSGKIFEYWFHAAAYLPMRDYRFALPRMLSFRRGESPYFKSVDKTLMTEILTRVQGEGSLKTRDLKQSTKGKGLWWDHGPGRQALDKLFMQGDLMIRERNGMEKVYVLREQLLPAVVNLQEPTAEEMAGHLLDNAVRAHGVFMLDQLLHLRTGKPLRNAMRDLLKVRLEQGEIETHPALPDTYAAADEHRASRRRPADTNVHLLSPFDNAVIHRERLLQLFNFDYRLESYVPALQRKYGYFCLPILWQGAFVGRIDCKADRGASCLQVHSLHLERGWVPDAIFHQRLQDAISELALFCGCTEVQQ